MDRKKVQTFLALVAPKDLTIPEIFKFSQEVFSEMMEEIESHHVEITGTPIFISYNRDGDIKKKFQHEICIPIKEFSNYTGKFEVKEISEFDCISGTFTGTMNEILTNGITQLLTEARENEVRLSNQMREVYHQWETPRSKKNVVEIQFGVQ